MQDIISSNAKQHEKYQVAIICAIGFEMSAVRYMLDREHPGLPLAQSDSNLYILGELSGHNVVLACLPGTQGKGAAATVATNLSRTFPAIKWRFLVGIGGGVPSGKHDIRLGDVVVSMPEGQYGGVVQYDLGKDAEDGFQLKGFLWPPPAILRTAAEMMRSDHLVENNKLEAHISQMLKDRPRLSHYKRPPPGHDILFEERHLHVTSGNECKNCDSAMIKCRPPRQPEGPEVHYGLIATGDRVMKSVAKRIAATGIAGDVLCFEMEAAGIASEFPCLVIRGISDYADSHKNDRWQHYAAAAAAASAKELLSYISPKQPLDHDTTLAPASQHTPLGRNESVSQQMSGQGIQNAGIFSVRGNVNFGVPFDQTEEAITEKCLAALGGNPRDDMKRIQHMKGGLLEASYRWIFENQSFRTWRDDPQARILWIKGDPGKGKTMLLCGIIRELELSTVSTGCLSYFFCQATDSDTNNATAVLRGLIYLLVKQQASLVSHVREHYGPDGKPLFREANAWVVFSDILSKMLYDAGLKNAWVIIDALDECETDLQKLLQFIRQHSSELPRIKWIISSRNRPDIDRQLKVHDPEVNISLDLAENEVEISTAVDAYIDARVPELDSFPDELKAKVRDAIRQKANGTFLWVSLVLKELQEAQSWDILQVVEELPVDLEKLYDRMISQIQKLRRNDPEYCRLTLSAAALALRPLRLSELGVVSGLPDVIAGNMDYIRTVVAMCGSFLTIQDGYVYVIHQSVWDYLMGKDLIGSANGIIFPSGLFQVHHAMASRSLRAMKRLLGPNMYRLHDFGILIDEIKTPDADPLAAIGYSCVHWLDHLYAAYVSPDCVMECQRDLSEDGSVLGLFKERLLYWMESLCLMRKLQFGVLQLGRLLNVVQSKSDTYPYLIELVKDAEKFVLSCRSMIEQAPLQVYSSAIVFAPTTSRIRNLYLEEKPSFIQNIKGVQNAWGGHRQTLEHHDWVTAMASSSDGKMLISATYGGTVHLWDTETGELREKLTGLEGPSTKFNAVALSPDGKTLTFAANGGALYLWDMEKETFSQTMEESDHEISATALSPDGTTLLLGSFDDHLIFVWDTATGMLRRTLHATIDESSEKSSEEGSQKDCEVGSEEAGQEVVGLVFSPDGSMIASGDAYGYIHLWDTATGVLQQTLDEHDQLGWVIALSQDRKIVASTSESRAVLLWDTTGTLLQRLEGHTEDISTLDFSSDGNILVSASYDGAIHLWDTKGVLRQRLRGHSDAIQDLIFLPNAETFASLSEDGTISLWNTVSMLEDNIIGSWNAATGIDQQTLGHNKGVNAVKLSPDRKILVSASCDNTIRLWDPTTGRCQQTLWHGESVKHVAWSPESKTLASASNHTICLWDVATGTLRQVFEHDHACGILFSQDGATFVAASNDIRLWNVATGTFLQTIQHGGWSGVLALSPDSTTIAACQLDFVQLWDTTMGTLKHTLEHDYGMCATTFSRDGKTIASASNYSSSTIVLWDVMSGVALQKIIMPHPDYFESLSFSPDGKYLETDTGWVRVNSDPGVPNTSEDLKVVTKLFVYHEWITRDGKNLIWLPRNHTPTQPRRCVAVNDGLVVVGHATGRVTFFYFDMSAFE